jgi:aldehyde dehydrogenase (NAD(P)+)
MTITDSLILDGLIQELAVGAVRWADSPLGARSALLESTKAAIIANASAWVDAAVAIKGLDPASPLVGEEWISGPYAAISAAGTLAQSVADLGRGASPLAAVEFGAAPGGRVAIKVLPRNAMERVLFNGFSAEVWMAPGLQAAEIRAAAGLGALPQSGESEKAPRIGGVGLVLGAGNITSIPPLDVLYELVAENRAVLLKLNPILADMLPVFEAALSPLIDFGVLRIVQGGADVGGYLVQHPGISHVHITGSAATHDAIVYGPGIAGASAKSAGTPLLAKPITSELGGVSPIIVAPSGWTRRDLRYQAEHVVTQRLHNGGYNCIAGQVVVLSADWPQKAAFLGELRRALENAPGRPAWYPGSDVRVGSAASTYPETERFGPEGGRLLISLPVGGDSALLISTEYFSPVLGVIEVPGVGQEFLDAAVAVVNRDFAGTLGANVIIEPRAARALGDGFLDAIATLRYGTIGINVWTGLGFLTAAAPWGAYPGATIADVKSGIGVVHNALLIDSPERVVVRGPFRPFPYSFAHGEFTLFPKPPWFVTAKSAARTGRLLAGFAARPSWLKMPAIFASAFRA